VGRLLPLPVVAWIVALAGLSGLAFVQTDVSVGMVITSLVSALVLTPLLFGEEFGWRGYLQIRLFVDYPITSGVFHYPLFFLGSSRTLI